MSTNPFVKDSDYDGLSDYDEVNKYNTDPTNPDTDEDKVTDGDEIILGLDPNNPATFGYPDSEYTTEQTVEIDSSALQNINDLEDNPFTISVDITAAGVADHCLTADESGYSYPILQNDAVLGVVPEFSYSEGLTVSDVIINFNIVDSAVSDRIDVYSDDSNFDGINRFSIFKYFEEENILFPIETFYDENENRVYTNVDEVGTYCLIDMEKWINNIENAESGNYYLKDEEANDPANIVFCIDTRSIIDDEAFEEVKSSIKEIVEDAFDRYVNIKVYVYYQKFGSNFKVTNNLLTDINTGENYFTDYDAAEKSLDSLEKYLIKSKFWAYDYTAATQFMLDTCDENIIALYHIISDQRVMGSADKTKKLLNALENDERVYVSTICPFSDKAIDESSYAVAFAEKTKGIVYTQADYRNYNSEQEIEDDELVQATMASFALSPSNSSDTVLQDELISSYKRYTYESLKGILGDGIEQSEFKIISSTGTTNIKLDTALKPKSYYDMIGIDPTDTDKDGLNDWDEVDINFIRTIYKKNGVNISRSIKTGDLPKLGEYRSYYSNLGEQKIYVEQGYKQLLNKFRKLLQYVPEADTPEEVVDEIRVLPILSCPVDADGDNDGIPDYCDLNKLCKGDVFDDMDTSNHPRSNINNDTFVIIKEFSFPITFKRQPYNQINVYSLPNQASKMPFVYSYSSNENIHTYAVVKNTDGYWIKVINKNNGKMGYVKWENRNIIDEFSVVNNAINCFETMNTKLLLSHDDIVNALKESKCLKGDESIQNINSKLIKTTHEDGNAFKDGWQLGVKNSSFTYIDNNDLYRVQISNRFDNVDFYSVAVSHKLIIMAFESLSEKFPNSYTRNDMNYGGFKLKVKLIGDNSEIRYLNLITADAKSNIASANDPDEGNSLFPVSYNKDGTKRYCEDGTVEYHDHLFEFAVDDIPGELISTDTNVDYDKIFNLPKDANLKVDEVYIYIDDPLVSGNYVGLGFSDFGKFFKEEL